MLLITKILLNVITIFMILSLLSLTGNWLKFDVFTIPNQIVEKGIYTKDNPLHGVITILLSQYLIIECLNIF